MSVAAHLKIRLEDYDRQVRTFIPGYEDMLNAAAAACATALTRVAEPTIVDLGVGTGALASRCLDALPAAFLVGIDADADMLRVAMTRLSRRRAPVTLVHDDFAGMALPSANAMVATLALHHIRTVARKRAFYRRCAAALGPGGVIITGDCHPSSIPALAARQTQGWVSHMRETYSAVETRRFLRAWADEDTYMTLEEELSILKGAGFAVDVTWRRNGFAVIAGVVSAS